MKLAVIGAGAMGGALAAEAATAGHETRIVDVSRALVDRVNEHGVEVRQGDSSILAHPHATTDAAEVGIVDVVVLFVKAQHTASAVRSIGPLRGPATAIVSLQNGWGNSQVIADALGTRGLIFGVTYNSCSVHDLGVVEHGGHGETYVGAFDSAGTDALAQAAELLNSSGWSTTITDDVRTEIWKKLVLNAATLPTSSLTGFDSGTLGSSAAMRPLVEGLAREASAVAVAMGLGIDADERVDRIFQVLSNAGTSKSSMLQDVEARRATEIAVINRAVVEAGASNGVATPLNEAMVALIAAREQSWA